MNTILPNTNLVKTNLPKPKLALTREVVGHLTPLNEEDLRLVAGAAVMGYSVNVDAHNCHHLN
jgi:hypothetical protein